MIKQILDLLNMLPHYNQGENIEIAKGKFEQPKSFKQAFEQIKDNGKSYSRIRIKNNIKDLEKKVNDLVEKFGETEQAIKDIGKSTKNAEGGVKGLVNSFKGMGLAIKALGIGLVMEAFNMFKEVLSKNQKVVDIMNTALEALSIVFNDLIKLIFANFPKIVEFLKMFSSIQ